MMNGYGWNGGGWGTGRWVFMAVMMVIFWSAIVAAVFAVVRYSHHHHHVGPQSAGDVHDNALSVLAERFARGEIDADEFAKHRELLRAR